MFEHPAGVMIRGAVLLEPPLPIEEPVFIDGEMVPDDGDHEPIPDEVWREFYESAPFWDDWADIPFLDRPVEEALHGPLGAHTLRLLKRPRFFAAPMRVAALG